MSDQTFIVDASSWICLHEERYGPDVFPELWSRLRAFAEAGRIKAPREVLREVGEDGGVGAWARMIKPSIVPAVTTAIKTRLGAIHQAFPGLVQDYTADADPWLVAFGKEGSWVVVTEERWSTGATPKIPNVCDAYDVECINCTDLLRRLEIKWESTEPERSSGRVRKGVFR